MEVLSCLQSALEELALREDKQVMQQLGIGLLFYDVILIMYPFCLYVYRGIHDIAECTEMGSGNSDTSSQFITN